MTGKWWNGIHEGLKSLWPQGREGSTPSLPISNTIIKWRNLKTTYKGIIIASLVFIVLATFGWLLYILNEPEGYMGTSYFLFFIGLPMAYLAALFNGNTFSSMVLMTLFGLVEYIIIGYLVGLCVNKRCKNKTSTTS